MKTVGVDLSAEPARTAVCSIDWSTGDVALDARGKADEELVDLMVMADCVGIDAPLGWPDAFVEALQAHQRPDSLWPGRDRDPVEYRSALRFRLTDRLVAGDGKWPLSVSSDRIAVTAMRCARLQALVSLREPVDRSGATGRIVEVYPAAALRKWGLTSVGYKGAKGQAILEELATRLLGACACVAPKGVLREHFLRDDDNFDAFVCALVARAASAGKTIRPGPEHVDQARREGWIHIPNIDPGDFVLD